MSRGRKHFFLCLLTTLTLSIGSYTTSAADTVSVQLYATATNNEKGFKKFVFPIKAPFNAAYFVGLSGDVSIQSNRHMYSMALFTLRDIHSARDCPKQVEQFDNFRQLNDRHPDMRRIIGYILKKTDRGTSTIRTEFRLPVGIAVSDCLVLILDGGSNGDADPVTMRSNMTAYFSTEMAVSHLTSTIDTDDEFNFYKEWDKRLAFRRVIRIQKHVTLSALFGNISQAGPNDSPSGDAWSVYHDFYQYKHCLIPEGVSGPDYFYDSIPNNSLNLLSIAMQRAGMGSLQRPLFKTFGEIQLEPGDCIVHLVRVSSDRNLNVENQVRFVVTDKK